MEEPITHGSPSLGKNFAPVYELPSTENPIVCVRGGGASHVWAAFFPPEFEILSELVYNFQLLRDFVHGLSEFIALRQLNVQSYSS